MSYAAFVSSPDEGRKLLKRDLPARIESLCYMWPHRKQGWKAVSKEHRSGGPASGEPAGRDLQEEPRPVSNRMLAIFFAALAAALVLGYIFLNKLADISREEDCMLSRAKNCAATELPSNR